jgi:hypothetical protein
MTQRQLVLAGAALGMAGLVLVTAGGAEAKRPRAAAPPAEPARTADGALALGARMPGADTRMMGVDGREISLASAAGPKGTLVIFTCNHCPWVKAWETRIVDLGNKYSKSGFGVVAVNSNDPAQYPEDGLDGMKDRARERGMEYPYVVDATSDVARAFGATHTPEAFLFDKAGRLVYHGSIDDNAHEPDKVKARYLEQALDAVAGGRKVAVKETKALGCSIKYREKTSS